MEVLVEMTADTFSDNLGQINNMERKLTSELKAMLGIVVKVRLVAPKSIVRSEGKAVRVIDKRKIQGGCSMTIQQISVFLENRSGQLVEITDTLAKADIDLKAVNIAELSDYGVVRLIVANPQAALSLLKEQGFIVNLTEVVPVAVPDCVGGLNKVLTALASDNIDIEYMYSLLANSKDKAYMIFRVKDPNRLTELLSGYGFSEISPEELGIK